STYFIVDPFHYVNHQVTDLFCHTQCNPASRDGSQPDLVYGIHQADSYIIYVQAFNMETAEQLNAWFGGYEAQLNQND
ncbi:hypothetical protein M422DRAFT_194758, partial [Sphaerobolus stellatus SS14]